MGLPSLLLCSKPRASVINVCTLVDLTRASNYRPIQIFLFFFCDRCNIFRQSFSFIRPMWPHNLSVLFSSFLLLIKQRQFLSTMFYSSLFTSENILNNQIQPCLVLSSVFLVTGHISRTHKTSFSILL
jgi:hypothetical protein